MAEMTYELAMKNALDWAEGRRSHTNYGPHPPWTHDVIAVCDAQEVVKWTAIAAVLRPLSAEPEDDPPSGWYVHCGCDHHGDHLGCDSLCKECGGGCNQPLGVVATAPTEEEADRRSGHA